MINENIKNHTIFSAMQPTGTLHLGNYLGALKNWVDLQNSGEYNCIFSIVDLHAMTVDYNPKEMPKLILDLAIDYLSCGLDPEKSLIFVQSFIPEHTELAWILNCLTPIAELERMTQYKDKAKQHQLNVNAGLFAYPVLQAADILLYKADTVPVGEDQAQHVEFARIAARKFNKKFGQTFPEPKTLLTKSSRVMSLLEPTKKMSKSYGDKHCIYLTDSPKIIKQKIASAVTDVGPKEKEMSVGVKNLFDLLEIFAPKNIYDQVLGDYKNGSLKYVDLKTALADVIIEHLKPIQEKRRELEGNPSIIGQILAEGERRAQEIASANMSEIRKKIGIRMR